MSDPILANYHTHTARCQHAQGAEEEYIQAALQAGYRILGFSDHTPWNFGSGYDSYCRMRLYELPDYIQTLQALREKYAGRIRILIGLEAEYFPGHMDWLRQQAAHWQLDYLVFGNHFRRSEECGDYDGDACTPTMLNDYVDDAIRGMETGLFACLAHPDLCLNHYPRFDAEAEHAMRRLCEAAVRLDIPLEYNLLGEARRAAPRPDLGYTTPDFWRIAADYPVRVIVGSDAHSPAGIAPAAHVRKVQEMLRAMGIRVLDTLPGLA